MKVFKVITLSILAVMVSTSCEDDSNENPTPIPISKKPLVIAHRGAQSIFPEHTLEGYTKAIELGADYIEPDLVLTKDGYLVVRHEPMLSGTTNVSEIAEFASLKSTKNLDGKMVTDWFASDFTLAQIKTLKAKQAYNGRSEKLDNLYDIPTFEEVIALAKSQTTITNRVVGIYPEIKHPYFHNELFDFRMEDKLLEKLFEAGWTDSVSPVFVQCFEVEPLQYINTKSEVKLVQLISTYNVKKDGTLDFNVPEGETISYAAPFDFYSKGDPRTYEFFTTPEGMAFAATYADGIGPWKPFIISYKTNDDDAIELLPASNFVALAHENNLLVHPYTFRNEDLKWSKGNPENEYHLFFDAGIDGVFSDYTDEAVKAVASWEK